MDDRWIDQAACAGVDPEVFFPPVDRHGWSPDTARAICNTCPVKAACLTEAVDRHEPSGIWGGSGSGLRRDLARVRRMVTPGHVYAAGCGCVWCIRLTRHFRWLAERVAAHEAGRATGPLDPKNNKRRRGQVQDWNGGDVTHGARSTYARGCRCGRCTFASRSGRDIVRACGTDVPEWWDANYGPGHGYAHRGFSPAAQSSVGADEATAAAALLAGQVYARLGAVYRAKGWRLDRLRAEIEAAGTHVREDRLAVLTRDEDAGKPREAMSVREVAAVAAALGVDLAGALTERDAA